METGWYTLAHDLLDEAIRIDPDFHLAYVGKMLSNENMGYGMSDGDINYGKKMHEIMDSADFKVKLSIQEQLLVEALTKFQDGDDFSDGLKKMSEEFQKFRGLKDKIVQVVEGNVNLLSRNTYQILSRLADDDENVFALQLLTHNLNPYKNGKDSITPDSQKASTDAVFVYQRLGVNGAWQITADCSDIALYYSRWSFGRSLLDSQRTFLFRNTDPSDTSALLGEDEDNLLVHGLDVEYMSKALQRVNEYERLHFFQLQVLWTLCFRVKLKAYYCLTFYK